MFVRSLAVGTRITVVRRAAWNNSLQIFRKRKEPRIEPLIHSVNLDRLTHVSFVKRKNTSPSLKNFPYKTCKAEMQDHKNLKIIKVHIWYFYDYYTSFLFINCVLRYVKLRKANKNIDCANVVLNLQPTGTYPRNADKGTCSLPFNPRHIHHRSTLSSVSNTPGTQKKNSLH